MTNFEPGKLYYDVPEEIYYNHSALSNSDLKLIGQSPKDWLAGVRETTAAMEKGRAFHCYIGEREKFKKLYVKTPLVINAEKGILEEMRLDARTKTYKEFQAKHPNKQLMKHKDFRNLYWTKRAIKSDINAEALISLPGYSEVTGFFEYEGILCRFRADRITEKNGMHIIIDFKKVATRAGMYLTQNSIERYNRNFGCAQQAAFYRYGLRQILKTDNVIFVNIYVEMNDNKTASLGCVAAVMPEDVLTGEHGETAIHNAILDYKRFQETKWPTHAEYIIDRQVEMGIIAQRGIPSIGIGGWM
jgi:hypothetical protein